MNVVFNPVDNDCRYDQQKIHGLKRRVRYYENEYFHITYPAGFYEDYKRMLKADRIVRKIITAQKKIISLYEETRGLL